MFCSIFLVSFVAAHESEDNTNHVVVLPRSIKIVGTCKM